MRKQITYLLLTLAVFSFSFSYGQTWSNTATTGDWNVGANWVGGAVPTSTAGEEIIFSNNIQTTMINNLTDLNRHRISFNTGSSTGRVIGGATANTFVANGSNNPQITNRTTANHTINFPIEIAAGTILEVTNTTTGTITFGGTINGPAGSILRITVPTGSTVNFNGNITGGVKIEVSGAGTGNVNFVGTNTTTGDLEVVTARATINLGNVANSVTTAFYNELIVRGGAFFTLTSAAGTPNINPALDDRPRINIPNFTALAGSNITITRSQLNITGRCKKGGATFASNIFSLNSGGNLGIIRFADNSTLEYTGNGLTSGQQAVFNTEWVTSERANVVNTPTVYQVPFNVEISNPGQTRLLYTDLYCKGKFTIKEGAGLVIMNINSSQRVLSVGNGFVMEGSTRIRGGRFASLFIYGDGTTTFPAYNESNIRMEQPVGEYWNAAPATQTSPFYHYLRFLSTFDDIRLTINDSLYISPGTSGGTNVGGINNHTGRSVIVSNGFLTLRADANGAARYWTINSTAAEPLVGDFSFEVFVPLGEGSNDGRAWRFLSFPLRGSSIKLGQNIAGFNYPNDRVTGQDISFKSTPDQSYNRGVGTLVTPHNVRVGRPGFPAGYDGWPRLGTTSTTSIRKYRPDPTSGSWTGGQDLHNLLEQTNDEVATGDRAYMVFIRGNRDVTEPGSGSTLIKIVGSRPPSNFSVTVPGTATSKYIILANPFAGALDLAQFYAGVDGGGNSNESKLLTNYWWWNPDNNPSGGWENITRNELAWGDGQFLWPGQAILIEPNQADPVNLVFDESMKLSSVASNPATTPFETAPVTSHGILNMLWRMVGEDGKIFRMDVANIHFDDGFDNGKGDKYDIQKLFSFNKATSLSSRIDGAFYTRQGRKIPVQGDKIDLWFNGMTAGNYKFELTPTGMESYTAEAYLVDKFLNTETRINLSEKTVIDFTVTSDLASSSTTRFEIVFKEPATLPVNFTGINAQVVQGDVEVKWNTVTEKGLRHYEIQHSTNGREFGKAGIVIARNASPAAYSFTHQQPGNGVHYYRVRSEDLDGKNVVSQIVKVNIGNERPGFNVFPTVVTSENRVTLQLNGLNKGRYTVTLNDINGRQVLNTAFDYNGGSAAQGINLPATLSKGSYFIRLSSADNQQFTERIIKH